MILVLVDTLCTAQNQIRILHDTTIGGVAERPLCSRKLQYQCSLELISSYFCIHLFPFF